MNDGVKDGEIMGDLLIQGYSDTEKQEHVETEIEGAAAAKSEEESTCISEGDQTPLEAFRLTELIYDGPYRVCRKCSEPYLFPESYQDPKLKYPRSGFDLCSRCFSKLYFRTTTEGLQKLTELLNTEIPRQYRPTEFNTLDCSGRYGGQLNGVRQRVLRWAQDFIRGEKRSLFLFSSPGSHGSGCGNGKTHLLWSAYKFIARSTAYSRDEFGDQLTMPCRVLDLEALVDDFKERRKKCIGDNQPQFEMQTGDGYSKYYPFDEYRDHLARKPLLFIDDFGKGYPSGMLLETIEYIVDQRANLVRPTFYTSNYSVDDLGRRLGPRIASRVLRNGCEVIELKAPDYWRSRAFERPCAQNRTGDARPNEAAD